MELFIILMLAVSVLCVIATELISAKVDLALKKYKKSHTKVNCSIEYVELGKQAAKKPVFMRKAS